MHTYTHTYIINNINSDGSKTKYVNNIRFNKVRTGCKQPIICHKSTWCLFIIIKQHVANNFVTIHQQINNYYANIFTMALTNAS